MSALWCAVCGAARPLTLVLFVAILAGGFPSRLTAQWNNNTSAVGGISINTDGILENATTDALGQLSRARAQALKDMPAGLKNPVDQRKVSLRRLEAALQQHVSAGGEVPDEIRHLAGLQQIRYVFVYPDENDIVLVGPGEGWKVGPKGTVVGITTQRPVMLLEDLLVALRTARSAARDPISCSIDPTREGLARLQAHVAQLKTIGNPQQTAAGIEDVLGMQQITVTGIPGSSHFARVLVAADYRMKRLGMNFEPSPVRGLPSYLQMISGSGRGMSNMLPRWWLEPNYEPLVKSPDGLAWELRGASVKCMAEEDFVAASGARQGTVKASPVAQKWAAAMTEKYGQLAVAEPIFGELRNCMELAIVAALVVKENLAEKAGFSMPVLLDAGMVKTHEFDAPKQVASQATVLKKGRNWVISASGGVQVNSWAVADKVQPGDAPGQARAKAAPAKTGAFWWN